LGAFLYQQLLALSAGLPPDLREGSNDLAIYRQAGEGVLRGEIPYRDFFIEYPPGNLLAFVPPALFSTDEIGYITLFSSEMALVLAATLVLTALAARKLRGCGAWIVPALTFVAAAIMLYPVAVTRYDAVVALTLALAVLCATLLGGRKLLVAHVSLGFGAAAKLVPALATGPLALARRGVSRGYAVFFAAVALFLVPALLVGGSGFLVSFAYHAYRGLQVESIAASVLTLGWASGGVFEYGAFEVQGGGVELVGSFVSLTEVSEYAKGMPAERLEPRLHPKLPPPGARAIPRYTGGRIGDSFGSGTPMMCAKSIAFCTISILSSSVGSMFTIMSLITSGRG
jgi:hypothetical protein